MTDPETQAIRRLVILGGPAFPTPPVPGQPNYLGLTARDWFAGMALSGFLSNRNARLKDHDNVAGACYKFADAMLKERLGERRDYGDGDR